MTVRLNAQSKIFLASSSNSLTLAQSKRQATPSFGGALSLVNSLTVVDGCSFTSNTAAMGGAIQAYTYGRPSFSGKRFGLSILNSNFTSNKVCSLRRLLDSMGECICWLLGSTEALLRASWRQLVVHSCLTLAFVTQPRTATCRSPILSTPSNRMAGPFPSPTLPQASKLPS
jgi:hypothetical protein